MRLRIVISITLRLHWAFLALSVEESTRSLVEGATQTPAPIEVAAAMQGELDPCTCATTRRIDPPPASADGGAMVEEASA